MRDGVAGLQGMATPVLRCPPMSQTLPRTAELIRQQMHAGLHIGAQVYVLREGQAAADFAVGEARPGVAMTTGTVMLWMSATKPTGSVAIAQLWERGLLALDDPVAKHVPEFAQNGKERITIRHILTHTAGIRSIETGWPQATFEEVVAKVCAMRPERDWAPGRKAGYSAYVSWYMLAEIVRRLDGREYAQYVRQAIFEPLGMTDCWIAMPPGVYDAYGPRLGIMQKTEGGRVRDLGMDTEAACTNPRPSGSGHGPMREFGRFYQMLLAGGSLDGTRILMPQTVEALVARHRAGMYDHTFKHVLDFGLGFVLNSNQYGVDTVPYGYGPYAGPRTFGHSGMQSSCAFADPENRLAVAIVFNGTPGEAAHDRRVRAVLTTLYEELGLAS
jgi:CubicO group peptidase (beta-lactamase class C family)